MAKMAKVGGSRERESRSSRIRSILSEKKSENRSGKSKWGMSLLRILAVIVRYGPHLMIVMLFVTQNNF